MLSLPHGRALLFLGWLLVAVIVAGSLVPALPRSDILPGDKLGHFLAYFGLTLWFAGLYPLRRLWVIAMGFVLMSGLLEVLQGALTAHREMDIQDFAMNALGVAAACALAVLGLSRWAIRLEAWLTRRAIGQQ